MGWLDKNRTVAGPGFNRWLVPPAALAIHLAIGQVYAFSVFKTPMSHLMTAATPAAAKLANWNEEQIQWVFSLAIVVLGVSAALFGKWIENVGPRKAMAAAACCFGSGFLVSALGIHLHQLWLVYLGYGLIGGIGLGLGYLAPLAPLIRWFSDRPGMATGLAIMGFGGGAMIGGPLATDLINHFKSSHSSGVVQALVVMGVIYFAAMMFGALLIRIPASDWKPIAPPRAVKPSAMITTQSVDAHSAMRMPQFYLLWLVLCMNTTAGIGIIEQAAPMIRDLFTRGGRDQSLVTAAAATGFVGLMSLFNMGGRFFWSSLSDYLGRKTTFLCFFVIGIVMYLLLPHTNIDHANSVPMFVAVAAVILSMYGGGFATMPAYSKDLFGTASISAIYGRLLTAWSTAGIVGPFIVNHVGAYQDRHGVASAARYDMTYYIMAGLLGVGLIANLLIRPVTKKGEVAND